MDKLISVGPLFGYFPEPPKSSLIVKESSVSSAKELFDGSNVNVVLSNRYLGGVIGINLSFVESKVHEWSHQVELLSSIAVEQPQAAFKALTKSLQCQWIFLQRVTPKCGGLFAFTFHPLPSLFGHECSSLERFLYSLPIRMGGLNIQNPTTTAPQAYSFSRSSAYVLTESIKFHTPFHHVNHETNILQS